MADSRWMDTCEVFDVLVIGKVDLNALEEKTIHYLTFS